MTPTTVEEALVLAALARPVDGDRLRHLLEDADPEALGFLGWRALLVAESALDPTSTWAARTRSLRRRSHYAAAVASALAVRLHMALAEAGIAHGFFGDVVLATAFMQPPGQQPIGSISLVVAPATTPARLASALETATRGALSGATPLAGRVDGLRVAAYRGWPRRMGDIGLASVDVDTPGGRIPAVTAVHEAHRLLVMQGLPFQEAWLLDLAAVNGAHPQVWDEVPVVAQRAGRARTVSRSWRVAHEAGVAPEVAALGRDPWRADLRQRVWESERPWVHAGAAAARSLLRPKA